MILCESESGTTLTRLARELAVSARTIDRYVAELCQMTDPLGRRMVEAVGAGARRRLKLVRRQQSPDASSYRVATLYFALSVLRFLEGTVFEYDFADALAGLRSKLGRWQASRLQDLDRKFFAVQYAPKDLRKFEDQVDKAFRALIENIRVRIVYTPISGVERVHEFDPYTMIAYKGGLYLLGKSDHADRLLYLAIERMKSVDFVGNESGGFAHFRMPAKFRPGDFVEGVFGIVDGPSTRVMLKIRSAETMTYLRARIVHPRQRFLKYKGADCLEIPVRGTEELKNWIMGMSPYVEVVEPQSLRREIADKLRTSANLYR